jgi:hypothetical protein
MPELVYPPRLDRAPCDRCGRPDVLTRRDPDNPDGRLFRNHGGQRAAAYGLPGVDGRELVDTPSCVGSGRPVNPPTSQPVSG